MPVSQGLAAVQVARVFGLLQQGPFLLYCVPYSTSDPDAPFSCLEMA